MAISYSILVLADSCQLYIVTVIGMWKAYPYNHGKLKLSKDLKTAEAHLRASLIDRQEINNMNQIYDQRKTYYRIDSQAFTTPTLPEEPTEEQATSHLSYKEKVDLYRRKLQNQILENKYKSLFKKTEKQRHRMRKPVLHKLLEQFQEEYKHDDEVNIAEDLKESEKELEMIKINTNRKVAYKTTTKQSSFSRPRFISLQSGLPERETNPLPKWTDYLHGQTSHTSGTLHTTNIAYLENSLDTIILSQQQLGKTAQSPAKQRERSSSHAGEKGKQPESTDQDREERRERERPSHQYSLAAKREPRRILGKAGGTAGKVGSAGKSKKGKESASFNAERTFTKSQHYSRGVITTMGDFYETKHSKRDDYRKMVHYLKKDRPLTSDIRRRNYKVITTCTQEIKDCRLQSEMERLRLKERNSAFYLSLLESLEGYGLEDIKLSSQIVERTKLILDSNYFISKTHLLYIAQPLQHSPADVLSGQLLRRVEEFTEDP